jgi:hypothetical protein
MEEFWLKEKNSGGNEYIRGLRRVGIPCLGGAERFVFIIKFLKIKI